MKVLSYQDLNDLLHGAAILGTGGGGELDEGLALIEDALDLGKEFRLVSIDDVPDSALLCTPYLLGAISDPTAEEAALYTRLPRSPKPAILNAYDRFQTYLGQEFYGTLACEMGGTNTAVAFYAAAMNGHVIIDADPAGRAVPEITHSTYFLNDLPAAPIVMSNSFGECFVAENVIDDQRAEAIVRSLAIASRNDIAAIDHALPAHQLRDAVIKGTMSTALELGRVWRRALEAGHDTAQAVANAHGGLVVFSGTVRDSSWQTTGGFTLGEIQLDGDAEFHAQTMRIRLKNENMVAWLNEKVLATIPELICLFDRDTGKPVTNPHYHSGQAITVVVLPAPEAFTTPRGLATFGPAYAGVEGPYVPCIRD
ncbi:MAG: DUF917 domain-containing protein [Alphaproteobacteria bacterium]